MTIITVMLLKKFCVKGDSPSFLSALYYGVPKNPSLDIHAVLKSVRTAFRLCYALIVGKETVIL